MISRILLALLILSGTAFAEECGTLHKSLTDTVNKHDLIINKANKLFIDCLFDGTKDSRITELADELNKLQQESSAIKMDRLEQCMEVTTNATEFFRTVGDRVGEIFGKAVLACTDKGQEIIKSEMDDAEKVDSITELINSYISSE